MARATVHTYPVTIDYSLTIEKMVKAGDYDGYVDPEITEKNFLVDRANLPARVEQDLLLVNFYDMVTTPVAEARLDLLGYDWATAQMPAALAFGAQHPEIQRQFPIVALGSAWTDSYDDRDVGYLHCNGGRRELDLDWHGRQWGAHCRFLVVRKSKAL